MNISSIHQKFLESTGACTDSRKIFKNCLFFALKGENFNGNLYAEDAIQKGALYAIVDDESANISQKTILCKDVLSTLQELATYHRKYLNLPILALTGSNGKTTTKELIHAVLSEKFNCTATQGNLNNHIGVPLTLLSMNEDTEIGIVEMGANHLGEIQLLANIAQPNYGYITNFGKAHLEGFGSIKGVIQGKSELYKFLSDSAGKVFVNGADPKQMELTRNLQRIVFNLPDQESSVSLENTENALSISFRDTLIQTHLTGIYNFSNIAAAVAIGNYFNVPEEAIKKALEHYIPQMNRSQIITKGERKIILDAYNANPTSMKAALDSFLKAKETPKILILGDMFELGNASEKEHQNITDSLKDENIYKVFLVGEHFHKTIHNHPSIVSFPSFEKFTEAISKNPLPEKGFFLIKGSRGMALERILQFFDS